MNPKPSQRVIRLPVKKIGRQAIATAISTGILNRSAASETATPPVGEIAADTPSTARILKILLPTILPTAISRSPLMLASTEVANSGRAVPAATMVKPITNSLTPIDRAIAIALSTNQRDPCTNSNSPTTISPRLTIQVVAVAEAGVSALAPSACTSG